MNILNEFGKIFGEVEDVIHSPLYPIEEYTYNVSDTIIRGSWPSKNLLEKLKTLKVTKVINLCAERNQDKDIFKMEMLSTNIPIIDNCIPTEDDINKFLFEIQNNVCYVHCEEGKGRTGCMIAVYRIKLQSWDAIEALKEAEKFGLVVPAQKEFILNLGI